MTSASQFSLEEENFYKDIQDLVKKGSQNEKELSTFLQRYMDLLARADLDDETFIINFTKAALILEASAKVYGNKVDRLWLTLEQVLDALKVRGKNQNKKKGDNEEEVEDVDGEVPADDAEPLKKLPNPKRRKKLGEGLTSPDDFLEIDNISGLLGKNMNEDDSYGDVKIKFHEEIPNLFIRNKSDRKRIDVCLVQSTEDRDDSRLRDWFLSAENMLVKDIYFSQCLDVSELRISVNDGDYQIDRDNIFEVNSVFNSDNDVNENELPDQENVEGGVAPNELDKVPDDSNNNIENVPDADLRELTLEQILSQRSVPDEYREKIIEVLNRSHEVEVGKFPNIFLKRIEDCLIDLSEGNWSPTKFQDVIPSRKMRVKKTNKTPCQLCTRRTSHVKRGKRCQKSYKNPSLDTYFSPLAQTGVSDPPFGTLPGEELHSIFKVEVKLIERLGKMDNRRNMYEAYHLDDSDDEGSFVGFDPIENQPPLEDPNILNGVMDDDSAPEVDEGIEDTEPAECEGMQLPLPSTSNGTGISGSRPAPRRSPDPLVERSRMEYQEIINRQLQNQEAARSQFEKNKEMGMKIANWHASLAKKIEESQRREPFNVDEIAGKILQSFPSASNGENPVMSFETLVEGQSMRDIPRYFFTCLQLANERNIDLYQAHRDPLARNCIMMKQLRTSRHKGDTEVYMAGNTSSSSSDEDDDDEDLKDMGGYGNSPCAPPKRKRRDSTSSSSSGGESFHVPVDKGRLIRQAKRSRFGQLSQKMNKE